MKDTVHSESRNLNLKLSSCLFATICFMWLCNMQSLGSSYLHTIISYYFFAQLDLAKGIFWKT